MELLMLLGNPDCYDSLVSLLLWTKNCCFILSPSIEAELQPRVKITFSGRQCGFSEHEQECLFVGLRVKLIGQAEYGFYFYQGIEFLLETSSILNASFLLPAYHFHFLKAQAKCDYVTCRGQ